MNTILEYQLSTYAAAKVSPTTWMVKKFKFYDPHEWTSKTNYRNDNYTETQVFSGTDDPSEAVKLAVEWWEERRNG